MTNVIPGPGYGPLQGAVETHEPVASATAAAPPIQNTLLEALEMIAGKRQCLDNLMSDKDIARAALSSLPRQSEGWNEAIEAAARVAGTRNSNTPRGWIDQNGSKDTQLNPELYASMREAQEIERAIRLLTKPDANHSKQSNS